jgi:hypothetical protein
MRKVILGAYIMVSVTYISCLLVAFLKCIPFNNQWQIYPDPGSKSSSSVLLPLNGFSSPECRPLYARHLHSPDNLRYGNEHGDRLLSHGHSHPHGLEQQSPHTEEDRPRYHVQWWISRNGVWYPSLRVYLDCACPPLKMPLCVARTDS